MRKTDSVWKADLTRKTGSMRKIGSKLTNLDETRTRRTTTKYY